MSEDNPDITGVALQVQEQVHHCLHFLEVVPRIFELVGKH
jgi:hypothetical protein